MSDLCLVKGDDHDKDTNSKTSDRTTRVEVAKILRSRLETASKTEDQSSHKDGSSAAKVVSCSASDSSSEEGTPCEDRHNGATGTKISRALTRRKATHVSSADGLLKVFTNASLATAPPMTPRS